MEYKDCFAYNKKNKECECLLELYCKKEGKCNFYKSKEENKKYK